MRHYNYDNPVILINDGTDSDKNGLAFNRSYKHW